VENQQAGTRHLIDLRLDLIYVDGADRGQAVTILQNAS
jgi:hypothetical protein